MTACRNQSLLAFVVLTCLARADPNPTATCSGTDAINIAFVLNTTNITNNIVANPNPLTSDALLSLPGVGTNALAPTKRKLRRVSPSSQLMIHVSPTNSARPHDTVMILTPAGVEVMPEWLRGIIYQGQYLTNRYVVTDMQRTNVDQHSGGRGLTIPKESERQLGK
jgi:hypothetical protein